jgi:aminoglycoside phosphotransferase (APT) family kinase protein
VSDSTPRHVVAREPDWRQFEAEHRGLRVRSTRFLGEGWCSRVYLVNDELVVRCPKHAGQWQEIDREMAFLAFASGRLPLAVPRYVHAAPKSPAAAHGYAVYQYLPGSPLKTVALDSTRRAEAAERLAGFLCTLHALQPTADIGEMLPRDDARRAAEELVGRAERELAPRLEPAEARALEGELASHIAEPGYFAFIPRIIHADFSREHILVEGNSVAAVIDFGDVSWGDPDYDFMYLSLDSDEAFVDEVVRRYGHVNRDLLRAKLRFFTLIDLVDTLLNGEGLALDGQVEAAWRRLRSRVRASSN